MEKKQKSDRLSTQLAKMSIEPKVVELTADVVTIFLLNTLVLIKICFVVTTSIGL